ncbi:hypothetical protein AA637_08800 [Cyanobacterium sp. HL-69]|uniref:hypothetical protein n=1 Tax=Cyanobacterium sp. HL-69 TaxID=2054282 RepID=UPI000CA098CD|nr:hypothetical protein AA637_08800 [Cyanobacterium sp. HL-69]
MISNELIKKTFDYYDKFKDYDVVVSPSLPILYFGDLASYEKSDLKIVTVGKNPSDNEFRLKKNDSFSFVRFSNWENNTRNLTHTLNSYFEDKPLKQWFSCFEPILNGLSASYYRNNYPNIVLHTDICSPLATNPTWSKLTKGIQSDLYKEGLEIWKMLIEELQPDLILISIPRDIFQSIFKSTGKELINFSQKKDGELRRKPYVVEQYEYKLNSGKKVKVVFGQPANKPFGTICNQQKNEIGEMLCRK